MPTQTATPDAAFTAWARLNGDIVAFLTDPDFDPERSGFLADMVRLVTTGQRLSQRQADRVRDNVVRRHLRGTQQASVARRPTDSAAPTGRVTITGTVTTVQPTPGYHDDDIEHKMTVDTGTYQVRCTAPTALIAAAGSPEALTGRQVRLAVTLTPTPGNPAYANGTNPRRAGLLDALEQPSPAGPPLAA